MRIVQTLYTNSNNNLLKDSFGWYAPEYHWMSWTLSCLQLKKYYRQVHLYTNDRGAEMMTKTLGLPYTHVHTTHNRFTLPHAGLWALPKIYTYSLQNTSFLHVDGDVFIFKAFPGQFAKRALIAQNEEVATEYSISTQKELQKNFTWFPEEVQKDFEMAGPIHAVNAGVLGGSDLDFFKAYTQLAFEYIHRNTEHLSVVNASRFNMFFEQHLFYCFAKSKNRRITYLLDELFDGYKFEGLGNFWQVPHERHYLHLLGRYKQNAFTCDQLAGKLRACYPEYYYRIISLFKRNHIPLKHDYYAAFHSLSSDRFKKYFLTACKEFATNGTKKQHKATRLDFTKTFDGITRSKEYHFLRTMIDRADGDKDGLNKQDFKKDYHRFLKQIAKILVKSRSFSLRYLYGRDIHFETWYRMVFTEDKWQEHVKLVTCPEVSIITSEYNWGAFWSSYRHPGVKYYKTLQLVRGEYFSMLIPEAWQNGFSIYDLENLDVKLLHIMAQPLDINEILVRSTDFFEKEVIEKHRPEIQHLMILLLQQLVLKKAVKPCYEA